MHTMRFRLIFKALSDFAKWSSSINSLNSEFQVRQLNRPRFPAYSTKYLRPLRDCTRLVQDYRPSLKVLFSRPSSLHPLPCLDLNFFKIYPSNLARSQMSRPAIFRPSSHRPMANRFDSTHHLPKMFLSFGPGLISHYGGQPPKIRSGLLDVTLFNRTILHLNHRLPRQQPPPVSQMLVDPATQPLMISPRQSTISGRATEARTTPISLPASPVPTVACRVTGDRHARRSAETPICHLPTTPRSVAPSPVSPAKQHPRTTQPLA